MTDFWIAETMTGCLKNEQKNNTALTNNIYSLGTRGNIYQYQIRNCALKLQNALHARDCFPSLERNDYI